ncbi:uncharacterized protein [Arachis hypogaea]|uniref:uncharacterized protein n=1 Tax=Arachis hypogaea TaxID=3818 RepID=UPI003B2107E1
MIIIVWNVRGVANKATIRTLKEMKKNHKPDITILVETRCSGKKAEETVKSLGFRHSFFEHARGYSGGIWIMWDDDNLQISINASHQQYIHLKVKEFQREEWWLTAVYASPHENIRKELWEQLTQIGNGMREPWMLIGDFNEIADPTEKKGGSKSNSQECRRFKKRMNECKVMDLGFIGNKYTWKGAARDGLERVFKRLDRALSNLDWRITFSEARIEANKISSSPNGMKMI